MNGACPTDEMLERLLANQLSEAEEQALETHVANCRICQRQLEQLTRLTQSVHTRPTWHVSNSECPPRSGGILARLADSSRPVLHLVKHHVPERKRPTESSPRRMRSSTIDRSGRFLRRQSWGWPLAVALVLGGMGWWVSRSVESAMRQQRINELTTVLGADVAALRQWMNYQRATAELVAADEALRPMVQELLALSNATPAAKGALVTAQSQVTIRSRLAEPLKRGEFTGFLLISPSGTA